MNLFSRLQMFFNVKTQAALDSVEDPRETLEYGYTRQQEMLRQVKRGLVEVATARRQLDLQTKKLRERVPQLEEQAKRALAAGREDLARLALQRKQTCLSELARLDQQIGEVAEEERKLTQAEQQFALRVDAFRTRRDTLSARYTAAEAQARIGEALTGVSKEYAELGSALERAEAKIERMRARASAIDALIESGALTLPGDDSIERELGELAASQAVDADLAVLKAQMSQPATEPNQ